MSPLDELCEVIGFNATANLIAWYGDTWLHVPSEADSEHILNFVLGADRFRDLVENWGGTAVWVSDPTVAHARMRRNRLIWEEICAGKSTVQIAEQFGLTERRVQQLAAKIPSKKPPRKRGSKKPPRKRGSKKPMEQLDLFPEDPGAEAVSELSRWVEDRVEGHVSQD